AQFGTVHRIPGTWHARRSHQGWCQRGEDLRRDCPHSRAGGSARTVQRSRGYAGTVGVAANFERSAANHVPCSWRAGFRHATQASDYERVALECEYCGMERKSKLERILIRFPVLSKRRKEPATRHL